MKRSALITIALLLICGLAFGQAVVTPNGQATSQGVLVPVAPVVSPPLIVTPTVHLSTQSTLPGSPSGAIGVPQPPSISPIRAEIEFSQPSVYYGPNVPGNRVGETEAANAAAAPSAAKSLNLGVNSGSAVARTNGQHGRSLGEIAREYRQRNQNANIKTFTNEDVARIGNTGGVAGNAGESTQNGAYPVANNGVILQNGTPVASPGVASPQGAMPPNATGQATEETQPANPPAVQQNSQPQQTSPFSKPSAAPSTPPRQMSQATTPPNPADQNAAANEPAGTQRTLPKTGSLLPIIAIVGLGATAAGLLSRK